MNQKTNTSKSIGIIGLGLIGGSLGLSLQKLGYQVTGIAHRESTFLRAKERGLANIVSTDLEALQNCRIIIIALPIEQLLNPDPRLIKSLPVNAVITDVGSVKAPILNIWQKLHPHFVASHPMAGTHQSGVEAGIDNLFAGKPWVATTNQETDPNALETIRRLAVSLGCQWIHTNANAHDQAVALISHLPVLVSAALLQTANNHKDKSILNLSKSLASSGFADTTRIGGGNPQLGLSMMKNNTSAILKSLASYQESLTILEKLIKSQKWTDLKQEFEKTNLSRSSFLKD